MKQVSAVASRYVVWERSRIMAGASAAWRNIVASSSARKTSNSPTSWMCIAQLRRLPALRARDRRIQDQIAISTAIAHARTQRAASETVMHADCMTAVADRQILERRDLQHTCRIALVRSHGSSLEVDR